MKEYFVFSIRTERQKNCWKNALQYKKIRAFEMELQEVEVTSFLNVNRSISETDIEEYKQHRVDHKDSGRIFLFQSTHIIYFTSGYFRSYRKNCISANRLQMFTCRMYTEFLSSYRKFRKENFSYVIAKYLSLNTKSKNSMNSKFRNNKLDQIGSTAGVQISSVLPSQHFSVQKTYHITRNL